VDAILTYISHAWRHANLIAHTHQNGAPITHDT